MLEPFWTAVTFLMLGLLMIVVEIVIPGHFIAPLGGALAFLGALGLALPSLMFHSAIAWVLWPVAAVGSGWVNINLYKRWAPASRAPITLGVDSLPGHEAVVTLTVHKDSLDGKVRIRGQEWSARTEGDSIEPGRKVRVVRAEGVHVVVQAEP